MMKRGVLLLLIIAFLASCSKHEAKELRLEPDRVTKLEVWCNTTNENIKSLQSVLSAHDKNLHVTNISEGEDGFVVTLSDASTVQITNGVEVDGGISAEQEGNVVAPQISVKEQEEIYYWTVQIGSGVIEFLKDAEGEMIPTIDNSGEPEAENTIPKIELVEDSNNIHYWQLNGEWLMQNGERVKVLSETGSGVGGNKEGIFAKDGVSVKGDNVEFTLVDGETKISMPFKKGIVMAFQDDASHLKNPIMLLDLPEYLKKEDYTSITAKVTSERGIITEESDDISAWGYKLAEPTSNEGKTTLALTLLAPEDSRYSEKLEITVTIVDKFGVETSDTRNVQFFEGEVIDDLSKLTEDMTAIAFVGEFREIPVLNKELTVLDFSCATVTIFPEGQFIDLQQLTKIVLPESLTGINAKTFAGCLKLKTINISKSVKNIEESAFATCPNLNNITLPDGLEIINPVLFFDCRALTSIIIPESVTKIEYHAFLGSGLTKVTIPKNVISLKESAFGECANLKEVIFEEGIIWLDLNAFRDCPALTSIKIPKSMKEIDASAFSGCENLVSIIFVNTVDIPKIIDTQAGVTLPINTKFYVPAGKKNDYIAAWSEVIGTEKGQIKQENIIEL